MRRPVTRLIPSPSTELPLEGLYLNHDLYERGRPGKPFVYSNFIASLDGRIAIAREGSTTHAVPSATTNSRDWRLYQELAGQADLLITSGRYFRQSVLGEAQDELPLGTRQTFDDIHSWRSARGLAPQPDIAIMSGSLNIPVASLRPYRKRRIYAVTGEGADPDRAKTLQEHGVTVIRAGGGIKVNGKRMLEELTLLDYRSIYAIAGPAVFHTLLESRIVDRLYLTIAQVIIGGDIYDTLSQGALLNPAPGMALVGLCHDPHAPTGAGQLFAVLEPAGRDADTSPAPRDRP
ncbi:MAG TPA: dihydrofolate reductase family protein [Gammaproteobacteria bacterium]|nr:dihydrofolate reductase family protein [Gammaproteobacteria bacterium]